MKTPEEIIDWWLDRATEINGNPPNCDDVIEALDAAGYVIVRKEPTEAMIEAAWKAVDRLPVNKDCDETIASFRAMIAAAQTK